MYFLCNMYLTMFPVAVGGILNMIFTKTKFYNKHKYPIDHNKTLKDNKRIFGDNKTYIGFISMINFCIFNFLFFYASRRNTIFCFIVCYRFVYMMKFISLFVQGFYLIIVSCNFIFKVKEKRKTYRL